MAVRRSASRVSVTPSRPPTVESEIPRCPAFRPATEPRRSRRERLRQFIIPIAALGTLASLLVGSEVLEEHFLPNISTGWRHALLTLRAAVVTLAGGAAVYFPMRRRREQLSQTAEQLTRLLESYRTNRSTPARFKNRHLVHCCEALGCSPTKCSTEERCWHLLAANCSNGQPSGYAGAIQRCRACDIYRRSCPNSLTELGESFNNMMFLFENETRQVGSMRAQMVEKEKMVAIGQMASGVAHEVGNPLSSISSIVQVLKRSKTAEPKTEQLDLILKHIQRITTIVRQLVSLARPGTGGWRQLDIGQTLEEAVRLTSFDRRARNVKIIFTPAADLHPTVGLQSPLQQVFINLILNAFDAMPEGGTLRITAHAVRGGTEVRIEDTGSGIPPDVGRRIFEPFFTTKEVGHGTGLGLSVSYGIVQKHGGTIDVQPAESHGTVFIVFLPTLTRAPDENDGATDDFTRR